MMGEISGILWAGSASEDGEEPSPHHSMGEGGSGRWQIGFCLLYLFVDITNRHTKLRGW